MREQHADIVPFHDATLHSRMEIVLELQDLGHPIDLVDQNFARGVEGSTFCEWRPGASTDGATLLIETAYADVASRRNGSDFEADVQVSFYGPNEES